MAILTTADYPAIRAALDVDLTETKLPNRIIDLPIYRDAADQDVISILPDAETRTGEAANKVQRAAIFFCAARLAPVVVRLTSLTVQARDLSYSKPVFDPEKRAAELRQLAVEELADISSGSPTRPPFFSVATGTRGK